MCLRFFEEAVEVETVIPKERRQQRTADPVVDLCVPQTMEEIVPQERISERSCVVDAPMLEILEV